jgi:hypothetical protein
MQLDRVRRIRDQRIAAGAAFVFKQAAVNGAGRAAVVRISEPRGHLHLLDDLNSAATVESRTDLDPRRADPKAGRSRERPARCCSVATPDGSHIENRAAQSAIPFFR